MSTYAPELEQPSTSRVRAAGVSYGTFENQRKTADVVLWSARVTLLLALFVSTWCLAGYFATGRLITLGIVTLSLAISLVHPKVYTSIKTGVPKTIVIALLAVLLGSCQLIPLSKAIDLLSPGVSQIRADFAGDAAHRPLSIAVKDSPTYLSLSRWDTKTAVSTLVIGLAGLMLGWVLFRDDRSRLMLLVGFALCGSSIIFWGIIQQVAYPDQIIWGLSNPGQSKPFGTFLNRNHAADLLGMSIGCAMGLIYWCYGLRFGTSARSYAGVAFTAKWLVRPSVLSCLVLLGWLGLGLLLTLSRGGWLAAMIAIGVITGSVYLAEKKNRDGIRKPRNGRHRAGHQSNGGAFATLIILASLITTSGILLGFSKLGDRVSERLEQLGFSALASDTRFDHWVQALPAAAHYLPLGSGLGTYGYAHLPFTESLEGTWYSYAHNEYLEVLVEAGIPGIILLFALIVAFAHAMRGVFADRHSLAARATGLAACVAFVMQSVHAIGEFGLAMPANLLGLSILMGAGLAAASTAPRSGKQSRSRQAEPPLTGRHPIREGNQALGASRLRRDSGQEMHFSNERDSSGPRVNRHLAVSIGLSVFMTAGIFHLSNRVYLDRHLGHTEFSSLTPSPDIEETNARITQVKALVERFPDSQRPRLRLARLQAHSVRRTWYDELKQEAEDDGLVIDSAELWRSVGLDNAIYVLHQPHDTSQDQGTDGQRAELAHRLATNQGLNRVRSDLVDLLAINPMRPKARLLLAKVDAATGNPWRQHLSQLQQLSSGDPETSFAIGLLAMTAGDTTSMVRQWRQTIDFNPRMLETIVQVSRQSVPDQVVANELMPGKWDIPYRLSLEMKLNPADAHLRDLLLDRAAILIDQSDLGRLDRIRAHYQVANEQGDYPAAAEWLLKAVQLEPHDAYLRYQAANALVKSKRLNEAKTQIRIGSGLAPREERYKRLLLSLQHRDN
tara:strand:- start:152007 stop:154868 length:2862 start_codon:yes stop_codon:yes gene_type:complete